MGTWVAANPAAATPGHRSPAHHGTAWRAGGEPQPRLRRLAGAGDVVDLEAGGRIHQHLAIVPLETPVGRQETAAHRHPLMVCQIFGVGDRRAAGQVRRAGAQQPLRCSTGAVPPDWSRSCHRPALWRPALADGIHDAVGQLQLHLQPRIGLQEVRHQPAPPPAAPCLDGDRQLEGCRSPPAGWRSASALPGPAPPLPCCSAGSTAPPPRSGVSWRVER